MITVSRERPVAYFCAEYGLQSNLPIYAGGLGVLAGDTLKQASDDRFPMVGIGLLYRGGKAIQLIDLNGRQTEADMPVDPIELGFEHVYVPKEDQPLFVRIHLTTQDVWARIWQKTVGNTVLYLLDTDTDQNHPEDRGIARALYHGREEDVVRQQMILGIGGVKLLDALEIHPSLYHVNEGRPAFLYWQLIRQIMERSGLTYAEACEEARKNIVYTNHTLVRAGNQSYDMTLLKKYAKYYADKMGVSIDELLKPGLDQAMGGFSITHFALHNAVKASAVSKIHYDLSKKTWPEFSWEWITNGVHLPTWQDSEIKAADKTNDDLWHVHNHKKQELMEYVLAKTGYGYDPNRLVIGWSRRIAAYKRMDALFEDINRLKSIVSQPGQEVQILMAGRAHTDDQMAKDTLQKIIRYMQQELAGFALYIPNYDIDVAKMLVKGCDVWLNTPVLGQEASGTSGMKAIANGVLQCTVEDGWAAEVDWHDLGWTLDSTQISNTIYFRLAEDIIPEFYRRNQNGIPEKWLERMKRTILLSDQFSARRMLAEYQSKLYNCQVAS
jgi:glucan phosphorylase